MLNSACVTFHNLQETYSKTLARTRMLAAEKLNILRNYVPSLDQDIKEIMPDMTQPGHLHR